MDVTADQTRAQGQILEAMYILQPVDEFSCFLSFSPYSLRFSPLDLIRYCYKTHLTVVSTAIISFRVTPVARSSDSPTITKVYRIMARTMIIQKCTHILYACSRQIPQLPNPANERRAIPQSHCGVQQGCTFSQTRASSRSD